VRLSFRADLRTNPRTGLRVGRMAVWIGFVELLQDDDSMILGFGQW